MHLHLAVLCRALLQECVLPGTLSELQAYCDADPQCKGFSYKPGE